MSLEIDIFSDYDEADRFVGELTDRYAAQWKGREINRKDVAPCIMEIQSCALRFFESVIGKQDERLNRAACQLIEAAAAFKNRAFSQLSLQKLIPSNDNLFAMTKGPLKERSGAKHTKEVMLATAAVAYVVMARILILRSRGEREGFASNVEDGWEPIISDGQPNAVVPPTGLGLLYPGHLVLGGMDEAQGGGNAVFTPQQTQLIGDPSKGTIHFHCGIDNTYEQTFVSGIQLYQTFNRQFAIQPNWIHKEGLLGGLSLVALEKTFPEAPKMPCYTSPDPSIDVQETDILSIVDYGTQWLGYMTLKLSEVEKAILYEMENLSGIAQKILEENNPRLKQVHVAFSNGGHVLNVAIQRLPKEYRDTIIVITVGTTKIIDRDTAHKAYNIIGKKDLACRLSNGGKKGIKAAKQNASVVVIPQEETQGLIGGHYFSQPEYQETILKIFERCIADFYEIY